MSKEAMKQAREALFEIEWSNNTQWQADRAKAAITALSQAISEAEKQEGQSNFCPNCEALSRELKTIKQEQGEPVAWMHKQGNHEEPSFRQLDDWEISNGWTQKPLYTTPQPAQKPLTDEQIYDMYNEPRSDAEMLAFAKAIEAAHGIKENT